MMCEFQSYNNIQLWLEGSNETEPTTIEITENAKTKGYKLKNLDIYFDEMQKFWRFRAILIK